MRPVLGLTTLSVLFLLPSFTRQNDVEAASGADRTPGSASAGAPSTDLTKMSLGQLVAVDLEPAQGGTGHHGRIHGKARRNVPDVLPSPTPPGPEAPSTGGGGPEEAEEYAVKAACLYKFIDFVKWTPQALPAGRATITIGVLGKDSFGPSLDVLNGKTAGGRRVVVRRFAELSAPEDVQILFICPSEAHHLKRILGAAEASHTLTVGDMKGFAAHGGIINFTTDNDRIGFEINPDAAARARLKISSQLLNLKVSKIVRG